MSLVVAQATDEGPRLVSDMRATYPDGRRPQFKTDTLKAIVVAPSITVCFAGDVQAGLQGVRQFALELRESSPLERLIDSLQTLTLDNRRPVDFIVATNSTNCQLTRIRGSLVERNLQIAWIGDPAAFEAFQLERNRPQDELRKTIESSLTPAQVVMSRLGRAMDAVIDNPKVNSVDGFCVAVAHKPTGFDYLPSGFIHLGRDIVIRPGEDLISKMAQSVEEGGYAVTVVEPAEPGTPALALNFPRARLGILFLPLQFDRGQLIEDVGPREFARVIFERYGVQMKDPTLR
jgi:hypothetical protein